MSLYSATYPISLWVLRIPFVDWLAHRGCKRSNPGCNHCWRIRMGINKWGVR